MVEAWQTQLSDAVSLQTTPDRTRNNLHHVPHSSSQYRRLTVHEDRVRFAHPAEASIATLLDSHNVCWQYEPTTFPLITAADGSPVQSFTPDFYLPDYDVYIEMTTMRQSLVTRKNRKFRLLREIYPELNVRLLYRKDVDLIVERYGLGSMTHVDTPGPIVAKADSIRRNVNDIAAELSGSSSLTFVALGSGALPITRLLAKAYGNVSGVNGDIVSLAVPRRRATRTTNEFGLSDTIKLDTRIVLVADVM